MRNLCRTVWGPLALVVLCLSDVEHLQGQCCKGSTAAAASITDSRASADVLLKQAAAFEREGVELATAGKVVESIQRFEVALQAGEEAVHLLSDSASHSGRFRPRSFDSRSVLCSPLRNIGNAYAFISRWKQAIESWNRTILLKCPENSITKLNVIKAMQKEGRMRDAKTQVLEMINAHEEREESHILNSDTLSECWNLLGGIFSSLRQFDESISAYTNAMSASPNVSQEALFGIAAVYREQGQFASALVYFRKLLKRYPTFNKALDGASVLLTDTVSWAVSTRGKVRKCRSDSYSATPSASSVSSAVNFDCLNEIQYNWIQELKFRVKKLFQTGDHGQQLQSRGPHPLLLSYLTDDAGLILKAVHNHVRQDFQLAKSIVHPFPLWTEKIAAFGENLHSNFRVGFVSSDFHNHPTSRLLHAMLTNLPTRSFVFSTTINADSSYIRHFKQHLGDAFIEVSGLSWVNIARKINTHKIHVLIDLKQMTAGSFAAASCALPSPVVVQYLGFPGGMAGFAGQFLVGDRFVSPPEYHMHHKESLILMPNSYQIASFAHQSPEEKDDIAVSNHDHELQRCNSTCSCHIRVCNLNHPRKIRPEIFQTWVKALRTLRSKLQSTTQGQCSGKREISLKMQLLSREALSRKNLKRWSEVDKDSLFGFLVLNSTKSHQEHLHRLEECDFFWDTFPYGAHTTASESLWSGTPVLTRPGESFASRVCASVSMAVGASEYIARNAPDYEALLVQHAYHSAIKNRPHLPKQTDVDVTFQGFSLKRRFRRSSANSFSPLFDVHTFADAFSKALKLAFEAWLASSNHLKGTRTDASDSKMSLKKSTYSVYVSK